MSTCAGPLPAATDPPLAPLASLLPLAPLAPLALCVVCAGSFGMLALSSVTNALSSGIRCILETGTPCAGP